MWNCISIRGIYITKNTKHGEEGVLKYMYIIKKLFWRDKFRDST